MATNDKLPEKNDVYVQGNQVWWDITIKDEDGQPVDPGTVTFSIRKPSAGTGQFITLVGTYTGGTASGNIIITRRGEGEYSALGVLDAAGEYRRRWETSGGVIAVKQTVFEVAASLV